MTITVAFIIALVWSLVGIAVLIGIMTIVDRHTPAPLFIAFVFICGPLAWTLATYAHFDNWREDRKRRHHSIMRSPI